MQLYTERKIKRYYKQYTRRNQLTNQRTDLSTRRETLVIPGFFRGSPRFRPQKNRPDALRAPRRAESFLKSPRGLICLCIALPKPRSSGPHSSRRRRARPDPRPPARKHRAHQCDRAECSGDREIIYRYIIANKVDRDCPPMLFHKSTAASYGLSCHFSRNVQYINLHRISACVHETYE